jgi:CheY-like chemotaxis protein
MSKRVKLDEIVVVKEKKAEFADALTACAFSGDFEKAIEAGCNDYISKPIDKTILYELINKHVNKSRITNNKIYQQ